MGSFNTVNGKYYCNAYFPLEPRTQLCCFNTVNGKYYCNISDDVKCALYEFQYRKR